MALIAKYSLNENSNDLVGTNNGTATNVTWVDGKQNKSASFNGTSSKISGSVSSLNMNNGYGFGYIFNPPSQPTGYRYSFNLADATYVGLIHDWGTSGTTPGIRTINTANTIIGRVNINPSISFNKPNHIFVRGNNTFIEVFINGNLIGTTTFTAMTLRTVDRFDLGTFSTGNSTGVIDEVEIYNHLPTVAEVKQRYSYFFGYL